MKVLFVSRHMAYFRHFDGVVRQLCSNGHTVEVLFGRVSAPSITNRALLACQAEMNGCKSGWALTRSDWWCKLLFSVRELISYANYLKPQHPATSVLVKRWERKVPRPLRIAIRNKGIKKLLARDEVQRALRKVESLAPPDSAIARWLEENKPDAVVASPFIFAFSIEVDYIKAAKALGIPTVVIVASWDNLTTKGTFQIIPDVILVWNYALLEEAVKLHNVPRHKIFVTGAPVFDPWFNMQPSLDRLSFCRQVGIDPDRPFVVYLCSSGFIAQDETKFVYDLAKSLSVCSDTNIRDMILLVRPHPANAEIWKGFAAENIIIWPQGGDVPETREARQDYYNTLYHSVGVAGVNTSAFIEAAIVGKPCITIMTEYYRQTQTELPHFHHLLDADFLEAAHNFSEFATLVARILCGEDSKANNRRRFVKEFVRPWGIEKPACRIMAKTIEAAAARCNIDEWDTVSPSDVEMRLQGS